MRASGSDLDLSASDLAYFLACHHRTALDLAVAHGLRKAPSWVDPIVMVLQERGLEHERAYVESLQARGIAITDLSEARDHEAVARTLKAMRAGADVIVQPALRDGRWFGRPDLLRKVARPSDLGAWSYEVYDAKLARETRGGTVLQLSLYAQLLGVAQGAMPERFYVVTPHPEQPVEPYRTHDYAAYFRLIRARLGETVAEDATVLAATHYPEPVDHCQVCRWWSVCDDRRHADDHLSLVANISRLHIRELQAAAVTTLAALGSLPDPLPLEPRRGAVETFVRVREQARVQLAGRTRGVPVHELLPIEADSGLARLPVPARGDLFLDLEGAPFACEGGREYLFGLAGDDGNGGDTYEAYWSGSAAEERRAFETVVDRMLAAWAAVARVVPAFWWRARVSSSRSARPRVRCSWRTRSVGMESWRRGCPSGDLRRRAPNCSPAIRHGTKRDGGIERARVPNRDPLLVFRAMRKGRQAVRRLVALVGTLVSVTIAMTTLEVGLRLVPRAVPLTVLAEFPAELRSVIARGYPVTTRDQLRFIPRDDGGPDLLAFQPSAEVRSHAPDPGMVGDVLLDTEGFCDPLPDPEVRPGSRSSASG